MPYWKEKPLRWGGRDYNPIAIVFVPWWRPRVLRFWDAYKSFKHGKPEEVVQLERTLFELVESD
jgi:hypothetical protein